MNEYTLGEPLTEAKRGERYIAIHKTNGNVDQGIFTVANYFDDRWNYYADPRPLPTPPEKDEQEAWFYRWPEQDDTYLPTYLLTDEGRRRLERLLRKEGE